MNNNNLHKDPRSREVHHFPEIDIQFQVSQDEVWENIVKLTDQPRVQAKRYSITLIHKFVLAATIFLLLGITGFLKFYTKTIYTQAGQQLTYVLPDGSVIEMNNQSAVRYHPYWYGYSRVIELDGEAFFKVTKGRGFKVKSQNKETSVLGTSFNVYSRNDGYHVTCFTGKVSVGSAGNNKRILLNPNEQATVNEDGSLLLVQQPDIRAVKSWRENMFVFTGESIVTVLREIERHYNIKIVFMASPDLRYTGNFSKSLSKTQVLDLVCTSLGLTFEARSDTEYLVD